VLHVFSAIFNKSGSKTDMMIATKHAIYYIDSIMLEKQPKHPTAALEKNQ
jgi:hypothetical protein